MAKRTIDRLNTIRAIPYEQYFGEMEIEEYDKERRIELANELENAFHKVFVIAKASKLIGTLNTAYLTELIADNYLSALSEKTLNLPNSELTEYVDDIAERIARATIDNIDNVYFTSTDRAKVIAENESNSIYNKDSLVDAMNNGYKYKTWITMKDSDVRHSHHLVHNEKIRINDLFEVGTDYLGYPKDQTYGPSACEIVNCRCTLKYSK